MRKAGGARVSASSAVSGKSALVIVESATKAKKIAKYLGPNYVVDASVGHIRDLPRGAADVPATYKGTPWARLGVNVEDDFAPLYIISPEKKAKVAELKRELKGVDELILATDPDREGEAIAWHLLEVLKPKVPVRRMVFHEITESAIREAVNNTREVDTNLVDAQETRRIVDRLYGYEISPVLWKKVMPRLSAGRVQSVATRIIVERERERIAFVPASYWDVSGSFAAENIAFPGRLVTVAGTKVATGRDFTDRGDVKKPDSVRVLDESAATTIASALEGGSLIVDAVEEKPYTRRPYPPFMTSTLQQEAGRKLHFTSERTMRVAQRLYENGFITYMRTDSTTLSAAGLDAARRQALELYGHEYVADGPRQYQRKVKNSQEAHEAIRPAGETFATPGALRNQLDAEEYRLYELIWKRTVASQMADAKGSSMKVTMLGDADGTEVTFSATGRTITFPGFLKAYVESVDDGSTDDAESRLPRLSEGQSVAIDSVTPDGHTTTPPSRYTEAALVKAMEEMGIGRPSTYASIIKTIKDRGYVYSRGSALVPSWVAFSVVGLLEQGFGSLVDYGFTSDMEDELDAIAAGRQTRSRWLTSFYFGEGPDADSGARQEIQRLGGLKELVGQNLEDLDARSINSLKMFTDSEGRDVVVRVGRYGPYLERVIGGTPDAPETQRANLPESMTPDELTLAGAEELFATPQGGRELGINPDNGRTVVVKEGRYGPYVTELVTDEERAGAEAEAEKVVAAERAEEDAQRAAEGKRAKNWGTKTAATQKEKRINALVTESLKPGTASLFKDMSTESVTINDALRLLSLPREVGTDDDGETITAQNGRYGPYLRKGRDSRSLDSEDKLFTVTLEEAKKIFAEPKRRGRSAASGPLRELGKDPISGEAMTIKDGRFGPYVTDGSVNASLRKGDTVENMTDERASELLSERRAKVGATGARATKKATKKTTKAAKKTTKKSTKKSTTKATAKKTATKRSR